MKKSYIIPEINSRVLESEYDLLTGSTISAASYDGTKIEFGGDAADGVVSDSRSILWDDED